jgi:hypothetical protein
MAFISATAAGEPVGVRVMPLVLLVLLAVSYVMRPANRRAAAVRP